MCGDRLGDGPAGSRLGVEHSRGTDCIITLALSPSPTHPGGQQSIFDQRLRFSPELWEDFNYPGRIRWFKPTKPHELWMKSCQ
jgi:hypothetical protein